MPSVTITSLVAIASRSLTLVDCLSLAVHGSPARMMSADEILTALAMSSMPNALVTSWGVVATLRLRPAVSLDLAIRMIAGAVSMV